MELTDDQWTLNWEAFMAHIEAGDFSVRPHAMQHAVKEGFTIGDIVDVTRRGLILEVYPERRRCLIYADVVVEGMHVPLHVICEHRKPDDPVDFVTAYIVADADWETPTRRRRRR